MLHAACCLGHLCRLEGHKEQKRSNHHQSPSAFDYVVRGKAKQGEDKHPLYSDSITSCLVFLVALSLSLELRGASVLPQRGYF
jgi:hypothetical protein